MVEPRYVRHVSGQGETWEVVDEHDTRFWVRSNLPPARDKSPYEGALVLPKSEYVLVELPERWMDVTAKCTLQGAGRHLNFDAQQPCVELPDGYHFRKVKVQDVEGLVALGCSIIWAFLVEKKETR